MFKAIYADDFLKATEVETTLQDLIKFDSGDAPGLDYEQAIQMTREWGYSFRAAGSAAPTMNPAVALKVEKATILGTIMDFRSAIEVETMKRALTSKQAFRNHVGLRMEAMRDTMTFLLEWNLIYGGAPVGIITGLPSGSSATYTVTITNASWCGGFWAGSENLPLDIYASDDSTKRNTSSSTAAFRVQSYDLDARTVTLVADSSSDWGSVTSGDHIWLYGATASTVFPGISTIIANQTSTINNISATTYAMWRGVQNTTSEQISMAGILQLDAKVAERSGGKKVAKKLLVSPRNYGLLNADLSGNRRYDGSYSRVKGDNGFGEIEYYSPSGLISVEAHKYVKDGDALLINPTHWKRVGPSDITFDSPAGSEGYFLLVPDKQQYEYRGYSHQGLLCDAPAANAIHTNLVVPS